MTDKIMTLHPQGKSGVNISKQKYDTVRQAIVSSLSEQGEMTFQQLNEAVGHKLQGHFTGSIGWYFTTVKLDLEARGIIEQVDGASPQRLRLLKSS